MKKPDYTGATPEKLARALLRPITPKTRSRQMDRQPPSDTEASKPLGRTAGAGKAQQDLRLPDPEGDAIIADAIDWMKKNI